MEGVESVTIESAGESVTMSGKDFKRAAASARASQAPSAHPRTTVERLLEDVAQILEESLPPFEASLDATSWELPASITVKVAFKPEKEGTDTKTGEPPQIIVSGKMALPSTVHEHGVSTSGGQMSLWA